MKIMKRLLAALLAAMLITGSVQISALRAEAESTEQVPYSLEETAGSGQTDYFTVTLDANGGTFVNEQDDLLQEIPLSAEAITKLVEPGAGISAVPVYEQGVIDLHFAGWSLERDGTSLSTAGEEYIPQGDCVLYALWEEDTSTEIPGEEFDPEEALADSSADDSAVEFSLQEMQEEDSLTDTGEVEQPQELSGEQEDAQPDAQADRGISNAEISGEDPAADQDSTPETADSAESSQSTEIPQDDPARDEISRENAEGSAETRTETSGQPPVPNKDLQEEGSLETVTTEAFDAAGTGIQVDVHSPQEIRSFIKAHPAPTVDDTFAVTPSAQAPYAAGQLSSQSLEYATNALNQMRYIAGIPADVSEKTDLTELAQAASLVNAANNTLTHTPSQPADMDDALYQLGYDGASQSNIAWGSSYGSHPGARQIAHSVFLWMSDSDSKNIDRVGHRRWILNPAMQYTGFGEAEGYSAVYAFDESRRGSSYSGVAWPAQNMPVEYFNNTDAWSVSFGTVLTGSDISVRLTRRSDGKTWNFSQADSSDGFFNVENSYIGQRGCVIFRPSSISYRAGDQFDVTISGAGTSPVSYSVSFFAVCDEHDYSSETLSDPTCTKSGEILHICQKCWDTWYESTSALGHDYQMTGMADGIVTMTCSRGDDVIQGSVPKSFTLFGKEGEPYDGSYSTAIPSGLEIGTKVSLWANWIEYTADTDTTFDEFVFETDRPEDCEIIRVTDTIAGIIFHEAGLFKIHVYPKYNPDAGVTRSIRIVKELAGVTLSSTLSSPQKFGTEGIPLTAAADGGRGTLRYTFVLIQADGTEKVLASDRATASWTFVPESTGSCRLRVDVKDTGDSNRTVASNELVFEILQGDTSVKEGKTITAAGPLTYGQKLSETAVNNASFIATASGAGLAGTFAFDTPALVPSAGSHQASWTFTPTDRRYAPVSGTLQVTVNKAVPVISKKPDAGTVTYHPDRTLQDSSLSGGTVNTSGHWEWKDGKTALQVPGGSYACRFVPNDSSNYENTQTEVQVTVSRAVPYVRSVSSASITYGETLADAQLSGSAQYSTNDRTAVPGTFRWADSTVSPSVSDSGRTYYNVIFTPADTLNYETVTSRTRLIVEKADHPAQMPPANISVPYSTQNVSDQILRDKSVTDWSFDAAALQKTLQVGKAEALTVVYHGRDAGNFKTETLQINVTRSSCEHKGRTSIRNGRDPSCTEEGATGDKYCDTCGELLESSKAIAAKGHTWDKGTVTLKPTLEAEGVRTCTCTVCKEKKTESIPRLIDIRSAVLQNFQEEAYYYGSAVEQSPTVVLDGKVLKKGSDYTLSFSSNNAVGTAEMAITGMGLYGGILMRNFAIVTAPDVPVTSLTLDPGSADLAATKTLQLHTDIEPTYASDQTLTWTSSNPSVATVSAEGLVKAKKYGRAVITARTSNGIKASCTIQTRFADVSNPGKSYFTPVYWAVDKGITVCTVYFRPEDSVTRGEFVAFLWRLSGKPKSSAKVSFKDVNTKTKFYDAIRWAVGKGIIKGYGDKTFRPENNVTRGETATMIWRYVGRPAPRTKKSPFSDIPVSTADSYKAILWGSENGIIKGSGGRFLKNDGCTRGQVMTFLYRYSQKFR